MTGYFIVKLCPPSAHGWAESAQGQGAPRGDRGTSAGCLSPAVCETGLEVTLSFPRKTKHTLKTETFAAFIHGDNPCLPVPEGQSGLLGSISQEYHPRTSMSFPNLQLMINQVENFISGEELPFQFSLCLGTGVCSGLGRTVRLHGLGGLFQPQ